MLGESSPGRPYVFLNILKLAIDTKNTSKLVGRLEYVDKWVKIWTLTPEQKREIYLLASQVSEEGDAE